MQVDIALRPNLEKSSGKDGSSKDLEKGVDSNGMIRIGNNSDEELAYSKTRFSRWVESVEGAVSGFSKRYRDRLTKGFYILMLVLYLIYFVFSINYRFGDEGSIVLVVITVFLLVKVFFKVLDSHGVVLGLPTSLRAVRDSPRGRRLKTMLRYLSSVCAAVGIFLYLSISVFPEQTTNLQSFGGMLAMIVICFVLSNKPSRVDWHPVFWSLVLQFALAFFTLRTRIGRDIFVWLGDQVDMLIKFSDKGSALVVGKDFAKFGLALAISGSIIFINATISLLNHWGAIQFIVLKVGGFLSFCLGTGPVESIVAAANIFLGQAEVPLLIRSYLPTISNSELHSIMACGFASIAGSMIALFVELGAPASHLLTAAIISAPAALAMSKLIYPETERGYLGSQKKLTIDQPKDANGLGAFADGAIIAVGVCVAIWSNTLAFVSILTLMDVLIAWIGARVGFPGLSFGLICSYLLFPLAFIMGVDTSDCRKVGELIGVKMFATPIVGYQQLGVLIDNRQVFESYLSSSNDSSWHWEGGDIVLSAVNTTLKGGILLERTEVITTYAMCGFSAFPAIGVCLGAIVPLCPSRKQDVQNMLVSAFIAGNMANFATGCIAGVVFK